MINSQQLVTGATTTDAPAATTNGDNYVLAWRSATDQTIWWTTCPATRGQDSYAWGKITKVPNAGTSGGPALASLNGTVWMAWKGQSADPRIFISWLSGSTWSPGVPISGIGTSSSPALTVTASELYLVWKGETDNKILWSKSSDGKAWSKQAPVPGAASSDTPALTGFKGAVYLAWKGESDKKIWWSEYTEADGWGSASALSSNFGSASGLSSPFQTAVGPALGVGDTGNVHLAWKALDSTIWTATWVPVDRKWSPETKIPVVKTASRPALASQVSAATDILLAWKGATSSGLWVGPLDALNNQPVTYHFAVQQINVVTQRSRNTESDSDYMTISVAVGSKPPLKKTFALGDHHYGDIFNSPDWFVATEVANDEKAVLSYAVINHGGSSSSADIMSNLESAGETLANAAIVAFATDVSATTGAALNVVLPGFGAVLVPLLDSALLALGDWLLSAVVGLFSAITPDCDGPVAAGVHAFTGAQLRKGIDPAMLSHTYGSDNCVGVNSPGGCGDNSLYDVNWYIVGQ